MEKTCTACGILKPIDQFATKTSGRFGVQARCRPCQAAYRKRWYDGDPEAARAKSRAYHEANREAANARFAAGRRAKYATDPTYRAQRLAQSAARANALRLEVMRHYAGGDPCCACCGDTHLEFLHIDHVNGGGTKHMQQRGSRGSLGVLYWLRRNGYPEGFRVLCANCNHAFGRYGYCPHQRE